MPQARELASNHESDQLRGTLGFMKGLWALTHALQARSKRMESEIGVTGPQRLVLRLIGRFPGISAGELAELLSLHPSTLTGVLRRLEERRLLRRSADPDDGRRACFELSAAGRELNRERAGSVEAAVRRALARCPAEVTEHAEQLFATLVEELERG